MNFRRCNMILSALALCAGAVLQGTATAASADPVLLAMNGKWSIDYATDRCRLSAVFGTAESQMTLSLTQFSINGRMTLDLIGRPVSTPLRHSTLRFGFGPTGLVRKITTTNWNAGGVPAAYAASVNLAGTDVNRDRPERQLSPAEAASYTYADFQFGSGPFYRLQTGSLKGPLQALQKCTDNLVRTWGFDPAQVMAWTKTPEPVGNPGSWATSLDYPAKPRQGIFRGLIPFRLAIDTKGAVTGCYVAKDAGPEQFVLLTCQVLVARAKFSPAADASGNPVQSFWVGTIYWAPLDN